MISNEGKARWARMALALAALMLGFAVLCCMPAQRAYADDATDGGTVVKHIQNRNDFLALVALSRTQDTSNWTVYLDNDIQLGDDDMQAIVKDTVKHLSFGNSEHPFAGVFDGQNHTVKGLKYANNAFDPERDTGFFAETNGATIKNFLVEDADVWADFRGGIIVGKAVNTHIENVMVMESTLHVTCANNALNLITNAGFEGGLIAGELSGCTAYNCEVRGGRAVNNTTSGVQALGGEGLYMSAFAGYVDNSTIEYSRVTPTRNDDGTVKAATDVTNKYDVAVDALGGNNVYASGFVGRMGGGAQIVDCFSTAKCYSYSASYVGVVAVTLAWSGGLAGRIDKADGNAITRSHYAGDLSSRQYNPVAVIPIIQNDVNLGGIAGRANNGDAVITDCYYKPSASTSGSSQGDASKKTVYALAGDKTATGAGFGPWSDDRYVDRALWESHDYDFAGGVTRSTGNGSHVNKWVMDYKLGIPVHGESVKATLDFPGAGNVTIKATKLGEDQTTSDPYTFAVSAVLAGTAQGLAEGDTAVAFVQETAAKDSSVASDANQGYRFMGWFRERSVTANAIDEDASWFDGKTDDKAVDAGKRVQENTAHDAFSEYVADNTGGNNGFADNDLFIASYQAQVLFHDVKGAVITAETGVENADTSADWYRYGANITPAIPKAAPSSSSATFIGWTNKPSSAASGAYESIASGDLAALKSDGRFFAVGQPITVTKPMDFYPVYTDYSSNIVTVFEGNEQDGSSNPALRKGVGSTAVVSETSGAKTEYTIVVRDANDKALAEGGALPYGYRFLGWYETKRVNGNSVDVRVSRDASYTLPANVDLTEEHVYTARFEYRVDYYARSFHNGSGNDNFDSELVYSKWQGYETPFETITGVSYIREDVVHWGPTHVDHGTSSSESNSCTSRFTSETKITAPLNAYSHNLRNDSGADPLYKVMFDTDFPGSGSIAESYENAGSKFTFTPTNARYTLHFWTLESEYRDADNWTYVKNPMSTGTLGTVNSRVYKGRAMVTANVPFYAKDDSVKVEGTRRYESSLLMNEDTMYTYKYPFMRTTTTVSADPVDGSKGSVNPELTMQASPNADAMAVPGYKFLGWITTAEVAKDSDVWNYIYDVSGDSFVTSDPAKVTPYLVTNDYTVTQAQDVYPVYAKYDVRYTTNLHRAGFDGTDTVNAPSYSIAPVLSEANGVISASVQPDITTPVYKGGDDLYKLTKVEIEKPDGTIHEIPSTGGNDTYSYTVDAGGTYTFVAYYTPLAVVYHLNAADIDGKVAQAGDILGNLNGGMPKPTFKASDVDTAAGGGFHAFVGWTAERPSSNTNFVIWSPSTDLATASTVVNAPMELFPVYRATTVAVQSNIDSELTDPESVRGLARTENGDQVSLAVKAADNVTGKNGQSYDFVGWSRDYASDSSYSLMTSEKDYVLEGSEPFADGTVYTAVYKKSPLKVRYHDSTGAVIYEADVEEGSARARAAGFIQQVQVPAIDKDGNPIYDENGNQETTEKDVAYDSDAYVDVAASLAKRAADTGDTYKEMFREWQWVKSDGKIVAWDYFKDEPIDENMDLYPNTFYVIAHDTSDGAVAGEANNVTAKLKWQLDPTAGNSVDGGKDKAPIKVCFAAPFAGTQLTVTVQRVSYSVDGAGNIESTQTPDNGFYVSLYSAGTGAGSFDAADYLQSKKTGEGDQGAGNAVFDFPSTHTLTIVKQCADVASAGQTFLFKVTKLAEGDGEEQSRTVSITLPSSATDSNGSSVFEAQAQLSVPSGSYRVEEVDAWAWRYSANILVGGVSSSTGEVGVSAATSTNDATVTFINEKANSQWLDGSSRAKNVWGNGVVSREANVNGE